MSVEDELFSPIAISSRNPSQDNDALAALIDPGGAIVKDRQRIIDLKRRVKTLETLLTTALGGEVETP